MTAQTVYRGGFSVQVCVPSDWTDDQVKEFADRDTLCGTQNGWIIRRKHEFTDGSEERVPCSQEAGHVHIVLDA